MAVCSGLAFSLASCGGTSYEQDNLASAATVTDLGALLVVTQVSSDSYCRSDSCPFGANGTMTTIEFDIVGSLETFADDLALHLPSWTVDAIDCSSGSDCGAEAVIVLDNGTDAFYMTIDGATGTITIDIKA